ncbi:hypothetical protein [Rufibacter roseus]|uniref:STAS/SEC14 domain-containing protein n=1 Tax=Rufibacter roseus TaxID=1567108 RepID=A0ABW2DQC3_9BACT|nr:hypothetical protein [Rufibacter roseus]
MEQKVKLKKVFGDVFFEAERVHGGDIVKARWFGAQSVETVMEGGYKFLEMMADRPYAKLLNSNKEVVGSWDMALGWAQNEWTPKMKEGGLRFLAQVVPSSIYASMTIESLVQKIDGEFEIRTFKEEADAEAWLLSIED